LYGIWSTKYNCNCIFFVGTSTPKKAAFPHPGSPTMPVSPELGSLINVRSPGDGIKRRNKYYPGDDLAMVKYIVTRNLQGDVKSHKDNMWMQMAKVRLKKSLA